MKPRAKALLLTRVTRSRKMQHVSIIPSSDVDVIDVVIPPEYFFVVNTAGIYKYMKMLPVAEIVYEKTVRVQYGVPRQYWIGKIEKIIDAKEPTPENIVKLAKEHGIDKDARVHDIATPFDDIQSLMMSILRAVTTRLPSRATTMPTIITVDGKKLVIPLPDIYMTVAERITSIEKMVELPNAGIVFIITGMEMTMDEFRDSVIRRLPMSISMFWETYDNMAVEISEEEE